MTTLGKLLVFLNLVFAVGAATWAAGVYSQRPAWFEPVPDGGFPKGETPASFAALAAELDTLGKAATAAGGQWSANYARLVQAEETRAVRLVKMFGDAGGKTKGLLGVARTGGYTGTKDKDRDAAFFNLKANPATGLLDLDPNPADKGVVVQGPDGLPLRGADTLLDRFNVNAKRIGELAFESKAARAEQKRLGEIVLLEERRLLDQRVIREGVRVEAAYLAGVEVNAAGQLDWAKTQQRLLQDELKKFRPRD